MISKLLSLTCSIFFYYIVFELKPENFGSISFTAIRVQGDLK